MRRKLGTVGLLLWCGCFSANREGGASSSGTGGPSGSTTSGGIAGPCGPGTFWVGDRCVAQSCTSPVGGFGFAACQLPDGGLGECSHGTCISPNDPENCGELGVICPAPDVCWEGACRSFNDAGYTPITCDAPCPNPEQQCIVGLGCVQSACVGADTDNLACDFDGGSYAFCCNGSCSSGDSQNCGGCGIKCPAGTVCSGISCSPVQIQPCVEGLPEPTDCNLPSGGVGLCCGGVCVDSSSDPLNCGWCSQTCPGESACSNSYCVQSSCGNGAGCPEAFQCVQLHYGSFANANLSTSATCFPTTCADVPGGSACALNDAGSLGSCCGTICSDLNDSTNCGVCGVACEAGEFCSFGFCRPYIDCANGGGSSPQAICQTDAGTAGSCCGSVCIDLTSPDTCTTCGPTCAHGICDGTNAFCMSDGGLGTCCGNVCNTSGLECGASCPAGTMSAPDQGGCLTPDGGNACGPGAVCPAGTICTESQCIPLLQCSPSLQMPGLNECAFGEAGGQCCGSDCTDPAEDPNNCFGCGVVCPSGICVAFVSNVGQCLPTGPTSDCQASCGADAVCFSGQCISGQCSGTNSFCLSENGTIGACCGQGGACAHLLDDPENCGICGNACGPGGTCINGSCANFPDCGNGRMQGYCNLDGGASFLCCPSAGCTDTATDPNNCGFCGFQCPPGLACVGGNCQ